mmetsp:Transcript_15983/g.50070  ORF Transcript_15983/g.50070 Transcript_15983/m.50070 type:complete len:91 (+) Transcript_15983:237-509(+)
MLALSRRVVVVGARMLMRATTWLAWAAAMGMRTLRRGQSQLLILYNHLLVRATQPLRLPLGLCGCRCPLLGCDSSLRSKLLLLCRGLLEL